MDSQLLHDIQQCVLSLPLPTPVPLPTPCGLPWDGTVGFDRTGDILRAEIDIKFHHSTRLADMLINKCEQVVLADRSGSPALPAGQARWRPEGLQRLIPGEEKATIKQRITEDRTRPRKDFFLSPIGTAPPPTPSGYDHENLGYPGNRQASIVKGRAPWLWTGPP